MAEIGQRIVQNEVRSQIEETSDLKLETAEKGARSLQKGGTWPVVIFPREGRLWNFGGTPKIHKRFLTNNISTRREVVEFRWDTDRCLTHIRDAAHSESTGSTWVGKEERDNVETHKVDSQLQSRIRCHVLRPLSILLLCSA